MIKRLEFETVRKDGTHVITEQRNSTVYRKINEIIDAINELEPLFTHWHDLDMADLRTDGPVADLSEFPNLQGNDVITVDEEKN